MDSGHVTSPIKRDWRNIHKRLIFNSKLKHSGNQGLAALSTNKLWSFSIFLPYNPTCDLLLYRSHSLSLRLVTLLNLRREPEKKKLSIQPTMPLQRGNGTSNKLFAVFKRESPYFDPLIEVEEVTVGNKGEIWRAKKLIFERSPYHLLKMHCTETCTTRQSVSSTKPLFRRIWMHSCSTRITFAGALSIKSQAKRNIQGMTRRSSPSLS